MEGGAHSSLMTHVYWLEVAVVALSLVFTKRVSNYVVVSFQQLILETDQLSSMHHLSFLECCVLQSHCDHGLRCVDW